MGWDDSTKDEAWAADASAPAEPSAEGAGPAEQAPPPEQSGPGPIPGQRAIASLVPFGLGQEKPHDYATLARAAWESRDNLRYAGRLLVFGVCDECSLGPRGLYDDVVEGMHLCGRRLRGLRRLTMPPLAPADLLDVERLRALDGEALERLGRLANPYLRRAGEPGFRHIGWEEALRLLEDEGRGVAPERLGFLVSARGITNETCYALSKAARLLGTNNVDLLSAPGRAEADRALEEALGIGGPTCALSDLIGSDLVLLVGARVAEEQPEMLRYLARAKERGARVVVIAPALEPGTDACWIPTEPLSALFGTRVLDDLVQVRPEGLGAFLDGVLKQLALEGALDAAFIERSTAGWEALAARLGRLSWEALERASGATRREMEWVALLMGRARTAVTVLGSGYTRGPGGEAAARAVVDLHLARGMIGRPKTGILTLRTHAGEQGGLEMGVGPDRLPGPVPLDEEEAASLAEAWEMPVPSRPGLGLVEMMAAAREGALELLYTAGGGLLEAEERPEQGAAALARVRLRVHQGATLDPAMLVDPAGAVLLLPSLTCHEQPGGGTFTSTERRVRLSPEIPGHPPVGEARPEWEIPCLFARALRPETTNALCWADGAEIRAEIAEIVPLYTGLERLAQPGDWLQWGGPQLFSDGTFLDLPEGRARFSARGDTP